MTIALIIAAGKGERTKLDIPKQFLHIEDKPIIIYTLQAFQQHPSIDSILVVCLEGWTEILRAYSKQYSITKLKQIVNGGITGHDSIYNGLLELKKYCSNNDIIVIHDGIRPLVSQEIISESISVYTKYGSAVTSIPCNEVAFSSENYLTANEEIPREKIIRTQTPQIFSFEKLWWAHIQANKLNIKSLASCSLFHMLGEKIYFSHGSEKNIKITTMDDVDIFRALLKLSDNTKVPK